jgi:hypothetical protein
MNKRLFIASGVFLLAVALWTYLGPADGGFELPRRTLAEEGKTGARILQAAAGLFLSLDEQERGKALFDYTNEERFNWHFIPRERKGLPLKELSDEKRAKVAALLSASLSESGFKKAEEIRGLEDVLREMEGAQGKFSRDPLLYYVSFFSKPSPAGRWGWRLEGHHLSLNFTLDGARLLSSTPAFFGANPAMVKEGPKKGLRVLAAVEDLARELVTSLDENQLKACLGKSAGDGQGAPEEVPQTQSPRYKGPFPAGVAAKELKPESRAILRKLLDEYRSRFPDDVAKAIEDEINAAGLENIHVAWAGGVKQWEAHSYLIHGPTFVINYADYQNGANHIHSSFRRLKNDFAYEGEAAGK